MEPFYLTAGSCITEKEAMDKAVALMRKSRENKQPEIVPEIWTMWKNTDKIVYVIAICRLPDAGTEGLFAALEGRLGIHLVPQSSTEFREKIPVIEPPPAPPANPGDAPNAPPKPD